MQTGMNNDLSVKSDIYNAYIFFDTVDKTDVNDFCTEEAEQELYRFIDEGLEDAKAGRVEPLEDAISNIKQRIAEKWNIKS